MHRLFITQSIVFVLIAFLYVYVGIYQGRVYTVFWFDAMLHTLGGFWGALIVAWCFSLSGVRLSFFQLLFFVLIIGLSWELFEYVFDIGGSNFMSYEADTIKDIITDLAGGTLGAKFVRARWYTVS